MSQESQQGKPAAAIMGMDVARKYEQKRFAGRRRMRHLDRIEKDFAHHVFALVGPQARVVDIPCGSGRFFDVFSEAQDLVMADLSESMLAVVKERHPLSAKVRLIQANVTDIPVPDDSADLCFCMRLFHHLPEEVKLAALKELARVSQRYVALSFYNRDCLRYYWRKGLGKKIRGQYITFDRLVALAKQAGLTACERFPKRNFIEQQCLVLFQKS
jgi:ubiquinone/menaquinone biosynthesis C-methylase UbiE